MFDESVARSPVLTVWVSPRYAYLCVAALVAVLAFAAGVNVLDDDNGAIVVAVEHVQLAWRMVEVNLGIREAWRSFLADCDPAEARIVFCLLPQTDVVLGLSCLSRQDPDDEDEDDHLPLQPAAISERFADAIATQHQAEVAVPPTVLDTQPVDDGEGPGNMGPGSDGAEDVVT